MKLSEYRKVARENTAKASEVTRHLSLAGVGIIWIFKNTDPTKPGLLEPFLIYPLLFLAIALLCDLLHYVLGGYIWINFFRKHEKSHQGGDPDVKAPSNLSHPLYILYYVKIFSMILAYFFIVGYLVGNL